MSTVWKALLGLALVVPLGAYVAGSLAASASEDPAPRQTIVIDQPAPSPSTTRGPRPSGTRESPRATDDGQERGDDGDDGDDVEVITPEYDDFDDHDDDHDDDHSGPGGGDDD